MNTRRFSGVLHVLALAGAAFLVACGGGGGSSPPPAVDPPPVPPVVEGPAWWGFGRDAQHTAVSGTVTQDLNRITWSTPIDLAPQYRPNGTLLIHYGSPVVTRRNTVIFPVKTGATSGFRIDARSGSNGTLMWSMPTEYILPAHSWVPSLNPVITSAGRLYAPTSGGRLMFRDNLESANETAQTAAFYGSASYAADSATYNASVFINTPLATDAQGNIYFGFVVTGVNPAGLASGIARVDAQGNGRWIAASAAEGVVATAKPAMNNAPALSPDGTTVYVAVNTAALPGTRQTGHLLALDSATLAVKARVRLVDPSTGAPATVSDNSTSSVMVGPDGRVFFGVLESAFGDHNGRGWMLQFDALLNPVGQPGSFGWDVTASLVPRAMVPAYTGTSAYLIAVKYNNYPGTGTGDGVNRLAVLDPTGSQPDSFSTRTVMREVLTIVGPTFESGNSGPVFEWCINTMAVDPFTNSILVNSEDGVLYRWHLPSNSFTQRIRITDGLGQAYTPTAVGADGAVYAIGNARLFSIGR
jgi:hypothetical protein